MSDFWASRLGTTSPPVPRQEPVSGGNGYRPWWDDSPQSPQPSPDQRVYPTGVQQQYQQAPQQLQIPPQAKSYKYTDTCPECGSRDYYAPVQEGGLSTMTGPSRARCFSCGYPMSQTGSAGIRTHSGTAATPTRQIHDGSSQVNNTPFVHI